MKTEISAGGIIVKKVKAGWHVLLLRDMNDSWTFPKGRIEKGETKKAAARREIQEEVGLTKIVYMRSVSPIAYIYRRGSLVHKKVYYFLFRVVTPEEIVCQKSEGIQEAKWLGFDQAFSIVGYPKTNRSLLRKTERLLQKMDPGSPARQASPGDAGGSPG